MTDKYEWQFGSKAGLLLTHINEYTPDRATYEITKNGEESGASKIQIEFHYDEHQIIIIDDGDGMGVDELNRVTQNIGRSSKADLKHYGVGMMSYLRLGRRLVIFSRCRNDKKVSIVSCTIMKDTIVSDTGGPREATKADMAEHLAASSKLSHGRKHGTVIIIEGVGQNKIMQRDFTFDMKEVFEKKRFEAYLRRMAGYNLASRSYYIKYGTNKAHRLTAKLGSGKHVKASFPSKEFPCERNGQPMNVFCSGEDTYELRVNLDLWMNTSEKGDIHLSEDRQNYLKMSDAMRHCRNLPYKSSIFLGSNLSKYLQGLVDINVKPLHGAEPLMIWSGSRMQLNTGGQFGECLANMLMHVDIEYLRPIVDEYVSNKLSMKDERRSREIQQDMEAMVKSHPKYWESLVSTQSMDEVNSYKLKCPSCGKPGSKSLGLPPTDQISDECIYFLQDSQTYYCGNCGHTWKRTPRPATKTTKKASPQYKKPKPGTGEMRRRKRGFGYSFSVRPFEPGDIRRTRVDNTTIEINSIHADYKQLSAMKGSIGGRLLKVYERQQALQAIVDHEFSNLTVQQALEKIRDGYAMVLTWNKDSNLQDDLADTPDESAGAPPSITQPTAADLKAAWEGQ